MYPMNAFKMKTMSDYVQSAFRDDYIKADRFMLYLLLGHWFVAAFVFSEAYSTYLYGSISGGFIVVINLILFKYYKGTSVFRFSVAISLMIFSAIYIQQYLGRIEMHFHIFLAMALLTLYKDIYPVIIATITTILHHIVFNYLQLNSVELLGTPIMIFNYGCGWDIVILHGIFALTEGIILSFIVRIQINNHIALINSEYNLKEEIKLNKKLSKEAEQFAWALNESNIISKTDPSGRITYVNKKFCELSGYTEKELIGQPHNMVRHPDMPSEIFRSMWETIKSKKIFKVLIKNLNKDGSIYYADSTIIPILNVDNEIEEFIGVRYDVTELVLAKEKALESQRAKDEFLANMSHELRTPLNSIMGFIKQADKKNQDKDIHEYLTTSLNSSTQLLELINNILDISKINDGKFTITKQPFLLYDNLKASLDVFKLGCVEKNISYIYDLHIENDLTLNGDWQRISQIINNLISNAVKFTHNGGSITIRAEYIDSVFIFSIEDTGIGLSEESKSRIFKAFEQADTSITREYGGTGLGLSITKQLVKMMDGEITLESTIDKGSHFVVSLPVESQVKSETEATVGTITKSNAMARTKLSGHVLVAEDNKTNQMLIKIILDEFGLTCDIANDGLEAVEMYKKNKYDLVLMDESMPNMSGTEAMQVIRSNHKEVVPIIAVTANTMKGDSQRFIQDGMDGFVAKPIEEELLYSELQKHLHQQDKPTHTSS